MEANSIQVALFYGLHRCLDRDINTISTDRHYVVWGFAAGNSVIYDGKCSADKVLLAHI